MHEDIRIIVLVAAAALFVTLRSQLYIQLKAERKLKQ